MLHGALVDEMIPSTSVPVFPKASVFVPLLPDPGNQTTFPGRLLDVAAFLHLGVEDEDLVTVEGVGCIPPA